MGSGDYLPSGLRVCPLYEKINKNIEKMRSNPIIHETVLYIRQNLKG